MSPDAPPTHDFVAPLVAALGVVAAGVIAAFVTLRVPFQNAQVERLKRAVAVREMLGRAAYDLQSRIWNICELKFMWFYKRGTEREKVYAIESTTFRIAQYFCYAEILRKELVFIESDMIIHKFLDEILSIWNTDSDRSLFRIFSDEQRAIGELLITSVSGGLNCVGFHEFTEKFPAGKNSTIDILRAQFVYLAKADDDALKRDSARLIRVQHSLIDLIKAIDRRKNKFLQRKLKRVGE